MDCNLKRLGTVTEGCQIVGISRPTYYYKPKVSRPNGTDLADRIEEIALEYPSYGYRRITAELRRQGLKVNHKRVYRIMRSQNLLCRAQKSFKVTTNSAHSLKKYPNLIEDLVPYRTDQVWHADITYIRIATSFVYLAALIDGFSRKVVGYGLGVGHCQQVLHLQRCLMPYPREIRVTLYTTPTRASSTAR
ncbi:MAG: hypothetical protein COT09_06205 [Candidatus Hydromicrobium americanum]|nr:MAG: hypothetical protein COT09_06205 [Candidatus Hydromicrobium americanum]